MTTRPRAEAARAFQTPSLHWRLCPAQVFVLVVSLTFNKEAERDKWVEAWLPMVDQARRPAAPAL